jgi:acyl carrier protein
VLQELTVRESRARLAAHENEVNQRMADIEPVRSFVRKEFLFDRDAPLADGDPLFPEVIDSLGIMEVVSFIEEQYGIEIAEEELLADNFRTLEAIGSLVDRKNNAG